MELLASKWKLIFLVGGVAGLAIFAFMPDYNTLQMSSDAKDFTSTLGDDEGRAIAANICDMIFALSYGVLGVVAFNRLATGKVALIGRCSRSAPRWPTRSRTSWCSSTSSPTRSRTAMST